MAINLKKEQMNIKKGFESGVAASDKTILNAFTDSTKEMNKIIDDFYKQFDLSDETIATLRQNPEFMLAADDLLGKSEKEITALFKKYETQLNTELVKSFNSGYAARLYEAELKTKFIYSMPRQALPFVKELLMNKKLFGFTVGERITSLQGNTLTNAKNWIEAALNNGLSINDTKKGLLDIMGYSPDGKRISGSSAKAVRIARTEMRRAATTAANLANEELTNTYEVQTTEIWIASLDRRTRAYHLAADNQIKGTIYPDKFLVGGEEMDYPLDPTASAANTVNCRCYVEYTSEPARETQRAVRVSETTADGKRQLPTNMNSASWQQWKEIRLGELGIDTSF